MGISVNDVSYQVAVADTPALRILGLMNVENLGTLDGMLFVYGEEQDVEHWIIMDYDARFYADSFKGLGPYDRAAIKFGYGQLVEVFEDGVAPFQFDFLNFLRDYSDLPRLLSGGLNCQVFSQNNPQSNQTVGLEPP